MAVPSGVPVGGLEGQVQGGGGGGSPWKMREKGKGVGRVGRVGGGVGTGKGTGKATYMRRVPPDVGLAPSNRWRALPSTPPCTLGPLPHTRLGRPVPEHCKKSQEGGKREGEGGEGRGFGLRKGPPIAMRDGGDPPNTSWGQTHIWGLPNAFVKTTL